MRNLFILIIVLMNLLSCQNEQIDTKENSTTNQNQQIDSNESIDKSPKQEVEYEPLDLEGSNIQILKPKTWFYQRLVNLNGITYYVTPNKLIDSEDDKIKNSEKLQKNKEITQKNDSELLNEKGVNKIKAENDTTKNNTEGVFKSGFSLVYIFGVKKTLGCYPSEQAEKFINNAKAINPNLNVKSILKEGLNGSSFKIEDKSASPNSFISSIFLISDDDNDTLHTFVFQNTQAEKDIFGPIGSHMLKNIKVTKIGFK